MKKFFLQIRYKLAGLLLLLKFHSPVSAQNAGGLFDAEINYYRGIDSIVQLPENPILFIGSSSIKNWLGFDSVFAGYPVLNRGFGGAQIYDVIYYADDVLLKYDPKQIVIYVGENDFAKSDSVSAEIVYGRFQELYLITRNKFPEVPILYLSIKPSPAKHDRMDKIKFYNHLVNDFIAMQNNITYVDVYSSMLIGDGKANRDLFYDDMTHMNANGYAVWDEMVKPLLLK